MVETINPEIVGNITEQGGSLIIVLSPIRIAIIDTTASYDTTENELFINRVNVPSAYQGRGFGSLLVTTLIDKARDVGFKRIVVTPGGYDPDRKDDQIRFYQRHGFKQQERDFFSLDL